MQQRFFIAAIAAAIPFISFDTATADVRDPDALEIVIITGTRLEEPAEDSIAPVIVITREEIERSTAIDAADLLQRYAGIELGRNGGFGQTTSVFMRGTNSNHTLVLVDGVRLNPGTIALAPLQNIDPASIERIEVVKGPRSTLWGSDAIGGVVNIITRRPEGTSVALGLGEHNTHTVRAGVGGSTDAWIWGIGFNQLETSGYPTHTEATEDHGFRNTNLHARIEGPLGSLGVEMSHWQARGKAEYWSFGNLSQKFFDATSALGLALPLTPMSQGRIRLTDMRSRIEQQEANFLGEFDEARTRRQGIEVQHETRFGLDDVLLVGGTSNRESIRARSFGTYYDEETDIKTGFIQYALGRGAHRVVAAASHVDHEGFGGHDTWNLDYGWTATDRLRLTLGAGTAFRAPNATDRFGFGGNPDLDPETSRSVEAGLRYRTGEYSTLSATIFETRIRDLIMWEVAGMENVDRARIRGLELGWSVRQGPWGFDMQATAQDPRNLSQDEVLARRARRSGSLSLDYQQGKMRWNAQVLLSGRRKDSSFNNITLPSYTVTNAGFDYALSHDLALSLRVENLFNRDYELASGYPVRGRHAMLELRTTFR